MIHSKYAVLDSEVLQTEIQTCKPIWKLLGYVSSVFNNSIVCGNTDLRLIIICLLYDDICDPGFVCAAEITGILLSIYYYCFMTYFYKVFHCVQIPKPGIINAKQINHVISGRRTPRRESSSANRINAEIDKN